MPSALTHQSLESGLRSGSSANVKSQDAESMGGIAQQTARITALATWGLACNMTIRIVHLHTYVASADLLKRHVSPLKCAPQPQAQPQLPHECAMHLSDVRAFPGMSQHMKATIM